VAWACPFHKLRSDDQDLEKGARVARKTIFVSDLSGEEIRAKDAAQVIIKYQDARRGQVVLDVNADEVEDLARKGMKQARQGRRPSADGST
jgi:hypothetical protein